MSEQLPCAKCEAVRESQLIEEEETVKIKGRDVIYKASFYRCLTCGEEFETPDLLDKNLEVAREAFDKLTKTPLPSELVDLRSKYNASQKAFGLLLGFGELTINNYEQGAIPDAPNRLLLKLAENPYVFQIIYGENKNRLGAIQRRRIEESEGFMAAQKWNGLESIYNELQADQRNYIEARAATFQSTLPKQLAIYLTASINRELFSVANWNPPISSTQREPESKIEHLKMAS